jgi:Secretion system C-terminal sorting domain
MVQLQNIITKMLYQKGLLLLIVLSSASFVNAQNVLYKATATATGFTQTLGTNVTVTRSARWSTTSANTCGIPTVTFTDTAVNFDKGRADGGAGNYNNFNFVLEPSNGYRFAIDSITFKISGDATTGVTCRGGLSFHNKSGTTVISKDFFPNNINCSGQTAATYLANSATQKWIPDFNNYGNNVVDSFANIYLFFYAAKSSSRIRVSEVTVWGCVTNFNVSIDCNNQPILSRSAFDYSKYQLYLADEFDGTTYNTNTWYPRVGVNGFKGINRDQNNSVRGGLLHMAYTADSVPSSTPGKVYDTAYYTGGLITQNNFKYGYYELKTKLFAPTPSITGFHQSFWSHGIGRNAYIRDNELSGTGAGQEIQCFEHDSYNKVLYPTIYNTKNPNNQFYAYYFQDIRDIDVSANFFTAAYEVTPDSMKLYFNGKLRLATAFDEHLQREILATQVWVTPTPTPVGYWKNPCPIPPPGAEMTVDYYRYFLPKSPIGYNFLSNFIFSHGRTKITEANKRSPVAWANPRTKDIMGNTLAFDTIAATLDSTMAYPDKLNEKWSMLHKHTAAYRTATRQMLEAIPNGTYRFSSYVKCSNRVGDTVELRVRTRNYNNTADTLYKQSANNFSNIADANWRLVSLLGVPVVYNQVVVEMYSSASANAYTFFDSLVFTGIKDSVPTVAKSGCSGGSLKLIAQKGIAETTTYQWQVSTYSNGSYNAWANLGNWGTGPNSTNGFGASYVGAATDTLIINNINSKLKNARYRCLMVTPESAIVSRYERYSPVFVFDSINPPIQITAQANVPVYLGGTLRLDAAFSGGSGGFNNFSWSGPNHFRDTSLHTFVANIANVNEGIYSVAVTDSKGCYKSDTILVSALSAPNSPVTIRAAYNEGLVAFSNLSLTATTTNGSNRLAFEWFSPNNTAIGTSKQLLINQVQVKNSGRYVVFVKDSVNNFIASDTINVLVNKRPQYISFTNINNISNVNSNTSVALSAASNIGLPVVFQSSNTALAAFPSANTLGFGRTRPDYAIDILEPIMTNKIRLISTQSSHFHIRELRVFAPNTNGYPNTPLLNGVENTIAGLNNLALSANITASGQYALGATYLPQNAADSTIATSWVSQANGVLPAEKWLQLNFTNPVNIGHIQFVSGFFSGSVWNAPVTQWKLQYWNGAEWSDITNCTVKITAFQSGDENTQPASAVQWLCVNTTAKTVTNISNTLPITLQHFTAQLQNKGTMLQWQITNVAEINTLTIEKSMDALHWVALNTLYRPLKNIDSLYHPDAFTNTYQVYYRLKMNDQLGKITYSPIRKLSLANSSTPVQVYPVPASNYVNVLMPNHTSTLAKQITVFNIEGRLVHRQPCIIGTNKVSMNQWIKGTYWLKVIGENEVQTFKIIKN